MAKSLTARLGLQRWSADTDTQERAEFDGGNAKLDDLAAMDMQGTLAARPAPAAANRGLYYAVVGDTDTTQNDRVYRSNGTAWLEVLSRPAANAAYRTVIAETVLGAAAASITFTAIPQTFRHLRLVLSARSDAAVTSAEVLLRINGNTGGNYSVQRLIAAGTAVSASEAVGQTSAPIAIIPAANATAGKFGTLDVVLPDYGSGTRHKTAASRGGSVFANAAGLLSVRDYIVGFDGTDPIDSLTLLLGSGSFVAGTVATLYGAKGI